MKNLSYIILILFSTSTFLASQINTEDTFDTVLDMDKDAPYSWVTNFNERNQSPKQRYKNEKTHKLDSTISVSDNYQPSGPFRTRTKRVYKFEKFRDLGFSYVNRSQKDMQKWAQWLYDARIPLIAGELHSHYNLLQAMGGILPPENEVQVFSVST